MIIKPSNLILLTWLSSFASYLKKSASSIKILSVVPVPTSPIILAVGNTKGSIESLALETKIPFTTLSSFCLIHVRGLFVAESLIPTPA